MPRVSVLHVSSCVSVLHVSSCINLKVSFPFSFLPKQLEQNDVVLKDCQAQQDRAKSAKTKVDYTSLVACRVPKARWVNDFIELYVAKASL